MRAGAVLPRLHSLCPFAAFSQLQPFDTMPKESKPKKAEPKAVKAASAKTAKSTAAKAVVTEPAKKPEAPAKTAPVKADKPAKAQKPAAKAVSAGFSREDVATRAYFISERRRFSGLPGTDEDDWHQAERELEAESAL